MIEWKDDRIAFAGFSMANSGLEKDAARMRAFKNLILGLPARRCTRSRR